MGDIMKFLDRACSGAGPLRKFRKIEIASGSRNPAPSADDWEEIADLTLNDKFNVGTVLTALVTSFDARDSVPAGVTVARALKVALPPKRGTSTGGPHAR